MLPNSESFMVAALAAAARAWTPSAAHAGSEERLEPQVRRLRKRQTRFAESVQRSGK
jgi:hypothetical protein